MEDTTVAGMLRIRPTHGSLTPDSSVLAPGSSTNRRYVVAPKHIALGNSIAYGGTVDARAHLDCVMTAATLELDGAPVLRAGELPV